MLEMDSRGYRARLDLQFANTDIFKANYSIDMRWDRERNSRKVLELTSCTYRYIHSFCV